MYLLYVDESGDPGINGSEHLLLAGAAVFEGKWQYIDRDLHRLICQYFPIEPRPTEIHAADLYKGKKEYRRLSPQDRAQLIQDLGNLVRNLLPTEVALFTVIADKRWWFRRNPGKSGDDLYAELFENLSGRFDLFLRRRFAENSPSKGIIIADPHKAALSEALRVNQRLFQRAGNRWSQLFNLVETVFFLASHESPGLQLADLCSYAVWRLVTKDDDSLISQIYQTFDREPLNSTRNPGKWHGVALLSDDPNIHARINRIWR